MKNKGIILCFAAGVCALVLSCQPLENNVNKNTLKNYYMGFEKEEDITGIVSYNRDGGYNSQLGMETDWIIKNDFRAHSGERVIGSVYNDDSVANDDWLVLPLMRLSENSTLSFFAAPQYIDRSEEIFDIIISGEENPVDESGESILHVEFPQDTDSWEEFTIDLGAYGNQDVYIAFHCTSVDQYCLRIDDITVTDISEM